MPFGYTLKLNQERDLDFDVERKVIRTVRDNDALRQDLQQRLLTVQGEDISEPSVGLPYITFLQDGFTEENIEQEVTQEILNEPRVAEVTDVTVTIDKRLRKAYITASATAIDGTDFDVASAFDIGDVE